MWFHCFPAQRASSASGSGVGATGPILSFSGDAEDEAVDLFAQATHLEEDESDDEEEGEDGEPEDDFNAAWEVLDLARAIYGKKIQEDDDEEVKLKLADTYIALGDVSLETGTLRRCLPCALIDIFDRKI